MLEVDCRWPMSTLYDNPSEDDNQYIVTGRGRRKAMTNHSVNSFGRGRQINFMSPIPGFSI